jgi:hypothetical protein
VVSDTHRDVSVPLHIPADGIRGHLAADPFLADLLKRLKDGGRLNAMQAWHFSLPTVSEVVGLAARCPSHEVSHASESDRGVLLHQVTRLCGTKLSCGSHVDVPLQRPAHSCSDADVHRVQEAQEAAIAAAQQAGWLHEDGSIVIKDVHTVISVRNGAKPQRQKLQLPDFMAKKLEQYRAMMNTSDDGGGTDDGKSRAAGS